jgi:hypothetical protein
MVTQILKRAGKWMWLQKRVGRVEGCGGVACDAADGVVPTGGLKVLFPRSVPLMM